MRCPFCKVDKDRVVDSRVIDEGMTIRRRRECLECQRRFTTYEKIEATPRMVAKKDGRREFFSRQKILDGLVKACEKRAISSEALEGVVDRIEAEAFAEGENDVPSRLIGEKVSRCLRELDLVAYVRFVSVYREYQDVSQFRLELEEIEPEDSSQAEFAASLDS